MILRRWQRGLEASWGKEGSLWCKPETGLQHFYWSLTVWIPLFWASPGCFRHEKCSFADRHKNNVRQQIGFFLWVPLLTSVFTITATHFNPLKARFFSIKIVNFLPISFTSVPRIGDISYKCTQTFVNVPQISKRTTILQLWRFDLIRNTIEFTCEYVCSCHRPPTTSCHRHLRGLC